MGKFFGFQEDTPIYDINEYFFADDETIKASQHEYAERMKNYLIKKAKTKVTICCSVILMISSVIFYHVGYNKGFEDNQPIADDGSVTVYVTPSGSKYHRRNCTYITPQNANDISLNRAKIQGYTPCSICH